MAFGLAYFGLLPKDEDDSLRGALSSIVAQGAFGRGMQVTA